jgi:hypothetical protein
LVLEKKSIFFHPDGVDPDQGATSKETSASRPEEVMKINYKMNPAL